MADARVKIAKDKAELVKALKDGSDMNGPFQTYADVIAFAAALGAKQGKQILLEEISNEIDPIRKDVFELKGYAALINLLAVTSTEDPKILALDEISIEERTKIFEEFANSGLEILQRMLKGSVDHLEQISLILKSMN
jgi:dnd system-associated protein 4